MNHADVSQPEYKLREQYRKNRNFIAKFLRANMKGPQAERIQHEFWWYRHEDEEVDIELGIKKRPQRYVSHLRLADINEHEKEY